MSSTSTSLLFKSFYEYIPIEDLESLPRKIRGIYALYQKDEKFLNLMYVGMTNYGVKGRLKNHSKNELKATAWTHCSVFEVWDNITLEQIQELEALFRQVLRKDATANKLNIQKRSTRFTKLEKETKSRARPTES